MSRYVVWCRRNCCLQYLSVTATRSERDPENMQNHFYWTFPDIWMVTDYPLAFLITVTVRWLNEYGALVEWYWQGKIKSATYCTTNSTHTGLGLNLSLWGERPEPNCLCCGVAGNSEIHLSGTKKGSITDKNITICDQLMLCKQVIIVYSEHHMKHTNTVCEENAQFFTVRAGSALIFRWLGWYLQFSMWVTENVSVVWIAKCKIVKRNGIL